MLFSLLAMISTHFILSKVTGLTQVVTNSLEPAPKMTSSFHWSHFWNWSGVTVWLPLCLNSTVLTKTRNWMSTVLGITNRRRTVGKVCFLLGLPMHSLFDLETEQNQVWYWKRKKPLVFPTFDLRPCFTDPHFPGLSSASAPESLGGSGDLNLQ